MSDVMVVITNGTHTLAVSDEDVVKASVGNDALNLDDEESLKQVALALAALRFTKSNLDVSALEVVAVVDTTFDTSEPDDPNDIGLNDAIFIEVAHQVLDNDELSISSDAMVSGFNVQSWSWLSPQAALGHLSKCAPVANRRSAQNRVDELEGQLSTLKAAARALAAGLRGDPSQFASASEDLIGNVEALLGARDASESIVYRSSIQTWEAGEGSADDFTPGQRKQWSVTVSQAGDQLRVCVWPKGEAIDDASTGLGVLVEVNKGFPALHISPNPNDDTCCHVHAISTHEVEVTPGTRYSPAGRHSVVYDGAPAYVLSNGMGG